MLRTSMRWVLLAAALGLAGCPGGDGGGDDAGGAEPPLETAQAKLDERLYCLPFTHPDKPPVLLVHGTFTSGYEQWNWSWLPLLANLGYDVCTVTYPDRGLGDMQVSAEYVVNALRRIRAESGRRVAVVGHSQGVAVPRWAIKWWPSARAAVDDFVMLAGPNHGTSIAALASLADLLPVDLPLGLFPELAFQLADSSDFMQASNRDDETPGDVSYTAIYTQFDELVQPVAPVPTAAVDFGLGNPMVSNILIQELCPGRFVDHVTIGLTDRLAFDLALDAVANPGPADIVRAGGPGVLCGLAPIIPDQVVAPEALSAMLGIIQQDIEDQGNLGNLHLAAGEPPLKPYAQP